MSHSIHVEDSLLGWVLCFHHVGPRDGTLAVSLGGKRLYLLRLFILKIYYFYFQKQYLIAKFFGAGLIARCACQAFKDLD